MSGKALVTSDGIAIVDSDGNEILECEDATKSDCCLPELLACPDATPSGIGLLPDHDPGGDTILYMGVCYTKGDPKRCLTPTTEAATTATGCDDAACGTLYQLTPCCDSGPTNKGLRPEDLPMGSGVGSTVADPADGACYTVGELAAGLTPTTTPWFSISTDCTSDDCPPCVECDPLCPYGEGKPAAPGTVTVMSTIKIYQCVGGSWVLKNTCSFTVVLTWNAANCAYDQANITCTGVAGFKAAMTYFPGPPECFWTVNYTAGTYTGHGVGPDQDVRKTVDGPIPFGHYADSIPLGICDGDNDGVYTYTLTGTVVS